MSVKKDNNVVFVEKIGTGVRKISSRPVHHISIEHADEPLKSSFKPQTANNAGITVHNNRKTHKIKFQNLLFNSRRQSKENSLHQSSSFIKITPDPTQVSLFNSQIAIKNLKTQNSKKQTLLNLNLKPSTDSRCEFRKSPLPTFKPRRIKREDIGTPFNV